GFPPPFHASSEVLTTVSARSSSAFVPHPETKASRTTITMLPRGMITPRRRLRRGQAPQGALHPAGPAQDHLLGDLPQGRGFKGTEVFVAGAGGDGAHTAVGERGEHAAGGDALRLEGVERLGAGLP